MHDSAMSFGKMFFETYAAKSEGLTIVDIGSQDVNGSLRSVSPAGNTFIGVDFTKANGVDIVITDPYRLPFDDNSVDICLSSSCFEHSEFFWLVFNDIMRVLKPSGLLYINVPSNGEFHRFPVDCWRFYPDSGMALQNWGRRSGYNVAMLESFTGRQHKSKWNDFVAVFVKDEKHAADYPERMQGRTENYMNGMTYGSTDVSRLSLSAEDQEPALGRRIKRALRRLVG
ncbi:MAG: class I SAM-dependent methyltransferase [Beijerinckiaceae bacterium]